MEGPVDVVARLVAHQSRLQPRSVHPRVALLALPTPPLCALVAADVFRDRRHVALRRLASFVGGGDGPVPVVDLDRMRLAEALESLRKGEITRVVLYGAADQPGFTRAVLCRWDGGVEILPPRRGSLLAPLLDDPTPTRWLAPGVVRILPGVPAPDARLVVAAVHGGSPPDMGEPDWRFYALDPDRAMAPWSGCLPEEARAGTERGQQLRDAWSNQHNPPTIRCAALGLDPVLDRSLADPSATVPTANRLHVVAGARGSGRTTHAERAAATLQQRERRVMQLSIRRQGAFRQLATDLRARTRRGATLSAFRAAELLELMDALRMLREAVLPALEGHDDVVMDGYIETRVASAEARLGWSIVEHALVRAFPEPATRVWLQTDADTAAQRDDGRDPDGEPALWWGMSRSLARQVGDGDLVLDGGANLEANAAAVMARIDAALHGHRAARFSVENLPTRDRLPRPRRDRCKIMLGAARALPALGEEVYKLRAVVDARSGPGGVPEGLWCEAYAVQLALDLLTTSYARARMPVWPSALRRVPWFHDLEVLDEVTRMIEPFVTVVGWAQSTGGFFRELADSDASAERLESAYLEALEEEALLRGWTREE